MRILTILIVLLLGAMVYVRLAPTDIARWHKASALTGPGDYAQENGFRIERRITVSPAEVLGKLEARALATPRTRLIAGSAEEGLLTFQTRSLLWGFPDYTTVSVTDDTLVIYGRARFGRSDMGVNKARVLGWFETLGPLTEPL